LNPKNNGYTKNFEIGLKSVTADFVLLCDQDDVWYDNKVEFLVSNFLQYPTYFVYMGDVLLVDKKLEPLGVTKLEIISKSGLSHKSYVMGASAMIKSDYLKILLPFPELDMTHDEWLVGNAHRIDKVYVDDKLVQKYRRHSSNASLAFHNQVNFNVFNKFIKLIKILYNRLIITSKELNKSLLLFYILSIKINEINGLDSYSLIKLENHVKVTLTRYNYLRKSFLSKLIALNKHFKIVGVKTGLLDLFSFSLFKVFN
jgi:glycosyltransferase involved in cell wall biosynthesis